MNGGRVYGQPVPVEPMPPSARAVASRTLGLDQPGVRNAGDHQLGDPHAAADDKRLAAEIDQDDLNLSPIIGIDGSRSVKDGDAVADGEARTRPNLAFAARRQGDREPGWNHGASARRDGERRVGGHGGVQIETGGQRALIGR